MNFDELYPKDYKPENHPEGYFPKPRSDYWKSTDDNLSRDDKTLQDDTTQDDKPSSNNKYARCDFDRANISNAGVVRTKDGALSSKDDDILSVLNTEVFSTISDDNTTIPTNLWYAFTCAQQLKSALSFPQIIPCKKLTTSATLPTKATKSSAAFDLYADENCQITSGENKTVSTGISMAIPNGYSGKIESRSGLALNSNIVAVGGVIDSDYRGEIKVILCVTSAQKNGAMRIVNVLKGDRIAQMSILIVPTFTLKEVEELPSALEKHDGFGSTGK